MRKDYLKAAKQTKPTSQPTLPYMFHALAGRDSLYAIRKAFDAAAKAQRARNMAADVWAALEKRPDVKGLDIVEIE